MSSCVVVRILLDGGGVCMITFGWIGACDTTIIGLLVGGGAVNIGGRVCCVQINVWGWVKE